MTSGQTPNVPFVHGVTPLMISSSCGHIDIVEAFITSGANVNQTDDFVQTALDYATGAKQDMTRDLLIQYDGLHGKDLVVTPEIIIPDNISTEKDVTHLQSTDISRRQQNFNISSIMKYLDDSITLILVNTNQVTQKTQ